MRQYKAASNFAEKSTKIYRCVDDICNLKLRVRINEVINKSLLDTVERRELEVKTFRWQQKVLGKCEREFYRDEKNCLTDLDWKYHEEAIKTHENEELVLYTYVNVDEYCSQEESVCYTNNETRIRSIENDTNGDKLDNCAQNMVSYIEECASDPFLHIDCNYMYIVADLGEYVDEIWVKSEQILCKLTYDIEKNVLLMRPDFTGFHAYLIIVNSDKTKTYEYTIENASDNTTNPQLLEQEEAVLHLVSNHRKKSREDIVDAKFIIPPSREWYVYLFCEILTGQGFEYDDIHVRYHLDLPEKWSCVDPANLGGSTQSCKVAKGNIAHFGYAFDLILNCEIQTLEDMKSIRLPCLYLEVISKGSWDRYRTEGLTYRYLPVFDRGNHFFELQCLRILPGSLSGNLRRFFIGDYKSYDDITWISRPKGHEDGILNKYGVNTVSTGKLTFRLNIVHQSAGFSEDKPRRRKEEIVLDKFESSALLKSTEQVIEAFKSARRRMTEARKKV